MYSPNYNLQSRESQIAQYNFVYQQQYADEVTGEVYVPQPVYATQPAVVPESPAYYSVEPPPIRYYNNNWVGDNRNDGWGRNYRNNNWGRDYRRNNGLFNPIRGFDDHRGGGRMDGGHFGGRGPGGGDHGRGGRRETRVHRI